MKRKLLFSLLTQTGALFQVLGLVSIGIATKYTDEKKRNKIIDEVSRLAFIISILFLAVSVIFSSQLVKFFHFNSTVPFYLLGVSLLIGVPASFASAYLQGKNRFKALSSINIILSISKLILSVVFVLMGLKTIGAVGGLVCAQLVALLYALKLGKGLKQFVSTHISIEKLELHVLKPELPYAFMVFTTSLTSNLLLSFDILVVKHYFKPAEAGLYTGISIISNIIIYISGPFAAVMIPSIKSGQSSNRNYQILLRSMLITASVGGGALLLFLFFPHLIVSILLGDKYSPYYSFLRGLSISMFLLSISNLLIYFHIGLRHFLVAPTVILGLITTIGLLMQNHSSMNAVVQD